MSGAGAPRAVVVGIGPGLGAALAHRFATGGFTVTGLARDPARLAEIDGVTVRAADAADLQLHLLAGTLTEPFRKA